ncbi:MAG: sortase B protein-sorting domain-containing protein [Wolbachia endosymbiont of Menacanthus eurysternus]|nr:sortase B protein-sorting domain-containing protein [Wolbachia endosymbiont of Menacanthus eurysternus]
MYDASSSSISLFIALLIASGLFKLRRNV